MTRLIHRALRDCVLAAAGVAALSGEAAAQLAPNDGKTVSPIKHVIVIIAENRTFDHLFGTYVPKPGQTDLNMLSEGVVGPDGRPGPNFGKAADFGQSRQRTAEQTNQFTLSPGGGKPYATLPPPGAAGSPTEADDARRPPFATLEAAANYEHGLYPGDLPLITTGASGLSGTQVPDTRIAGGAALPNGPFPLTGPALPYDSYTGSPVHRFYQMWQQLDCAAAHATAVNPTGCVADLFPWVEVTVGAGSNGALPPAGYDPATWQGDEGATAMGFVNMAEGDAPYFKALADQFAIGDNFHQSVMGGTGANHIMLGYADMLYYSKPDGTPGAPPPGQVENPNAQPGTNNYWINDGYGSERTGDGGSYSNCSDPTQPGVAAVTAYLGAIGVKPNCQPGAFYLLNNYNPAYVGNGTIDPTDNGPFTIPPTAMRHIGDALNDAKISWTYFGEGWNDYVLDPSPVTNRAGAIYCSICNPFQYSTTTMTSPAQRRAHIRDTTDLYNGIADGVLPAVSIVKPSGLNDGHPASSKLDLSESFTRKIITALQNNKALWADTAVIVTFDEGGGYWDSGYVQPVDFFGDGTRVPLIVVSPFSTGGRVVHTYYDHVSIDKFIERNWGLKPISGRSRDNLPNPVAAAGNPYVPTNRPAIGDLFEMFAFR